MGSDRLAKVNSLIAAEVGRELHERLNTPGTLATVTSVEVTADLNQAVVWVSLVPAVDEAWSAVEAARPHLQAHLARRLRMRQTPKLTLRRDQGAAHAQRIDDLLRGDR